MKKTKKATKGKKSNAKAKSSKKITKMKKSVLKSMKGGRDDAETVIKNRLR